VEPLTGPLRNGLRVEQRALDSKVTTTITLDLSAKALRYVLDVQWNEYAKDNEPVPVLTYAIPLAGSVDTFRMDVPAGAVDRAAKTADVPALSFDAALFGSRALALATDCKYGYRNANGELTVTLINSTANPDPYPERGEHRITLWVGVSCAEAKALKDAAIALTHPIAYCSVTRHKGALVPSGSFLTVEAGGTVVSALELAGDGCLLIRLVEMAGQEDIVRLQCPFPPAKAELVGWDEQPLAQAKVEGSCVVVGMGAHGIATVKIHGACN